MKWSLSFVSVTLITMIATGWWMTMARQKNVGDATSLVPPYAVQLNGLLGHRFQMNERNRLLALSEDALLSGFRKRPGIQAWIGEHVGKWLHAAVLTWINTGNRELKEKIERIVRELIATQEPDGYLGTYDAPTRWTMEKERGWDVWVHKYVLIGLLSYVSVVGDARQRTIDGELKQKALEAACKAADLILRTFGTGEGQLDLMERSTHVGMASGSILQPMVWLYKATGDKRYLDFCRYIVWAWENSPRGPKLLSSLLTHGNVRKTANGKAYEMMSCLVGALELYRVLRDEGNEEEGKQLLLAAQRAWDDIVQKRMYVTGGTSLGEHFQDDYFLPNDGAVSETCATVTLLQLTLELFRLTGEAKYMDIAERIVFNHLLAAQHPNGDRWCYFTPLEGKKQYRSDINCCASSGPRGIAMLPTFVYTLDQDGGIKCNIYVRGRLSLDDRGIAISQETNYPYDGGVTLRLHPVKPTEFALRFRVPEWCGEARVIINGKQMKLVGSGYHELKRKWRSDDEVRLEFTMKLRTVIGTHTNEGKMALMYGPLVLAVDERHLPAEARPLDAISMPSEDAEKLPLKIAPISGSSALWAGEAAFETDGIILGKESKFKLRLTDFAHAGAKGSAFTVWIKRKPGA
ncbi:MAG: glycoside hydrolase family 127 protein [Armatimonadota bacterium]|nr:glycoside hydrolase family 127 protein [Armatimonadota bacterium]MDW8026593.1 glycoside hydrolase family 127 protein [Armatimonadota bacterium]